jgi:hypothetical protein
MESESLWSASKQKMNLYIKLHLRVLMKTGIEENVEIIMFIVDPLLS